MKRPTWVALATTQLIVSPLTSTWALSILTEAIIGSLGCSQPVIQLGLYLCLHQNLGRRMRELEASKIVSIKESIE